MHTTRSPRLATLALTAVALAAVTGCGSGGSNGLSRTELIAKADPICHHANAAVDSTKFSLQDLASAGPQIAAAERQASTELAKLTPPSSMAADWGVIVDGFRRAAAGMQKAGEAAKSAGSSVQALTKSKAFSEGATEFTHGRQVRQSTAARNGFIDCAKF